MTDGGNRLRNFLSSTAMTFGFGSLVSAWILSAWWGIGHGSSPSRSSLGGSLDLLASVGFALWCLGIATIPRKNFRLANRRGKMALFSERDDPHRMGRWGIAAGLVLALLTVTAFGPLLKHGLDGHGALAGWKSLSFPFPF